MVQQPRFGSQWDRVFWLMISLGSAALSYAAYEWLYGKLGYGQAAATVASITLVSVVVHECAHWAAMERYGVRAHVVFLVAVGGAGPNDSDGLKRLNRFQTAVVVLAGPASNLGLVVAGLAMNHWGWHGQYGQAMASFNAAIACFNLLPVAVLDGKRFIMSVLESTDESTDGLLTAMGVTMAVGTAVLLFLLGRFSIYPALLVVYLVRSNGQDDPAAYRQKRSMKLNAAWASFFIWGMMWTASFCLYVYLPTWGSIFHP